MNSPESRAAGLREWAAEQLQTTPETPTDEQRRALLERLRDEDFLPPPALVEARRVMLEPSPALLSVADCPTFKSLCEDQLQAQLEMFESNFFELEPEERRAAWRDLVPQVADMPRLRARLDRLKTGLDFDVAVVAVGDPRAAELAGWCLELFVLDPLQRALRRRAIERSLGEKRATWQKAARDLQRQRPQIAALAPELVKPLTTWHTQERKAQSGQRRLLKQSRARQRAAAQKTSTSGWNWGWLAVVVVIALMRLVPGLGDHKSTSTKANFPRGSTVNSDPTAVLRTSQRNMARARLASDVSDAFGPETTPELLGWEGWDTRPRGHNELVNLLYELADDYLLMQNHEVRRALRMLNEQGEIEAQMLQVNINEKRKRLRELAIEGSAKDKTEVFELIKDVSPSATPPKSAQPESAEP